MVRHHVKKKKKGGKQQKEKELEEKKRAQANRLKNLDRFAGSSEEEEGNNDVDTDDESLDNSKHGQQNLPLDDKESIESSSDGDDEVDSDDNDEEEEKMKSDQQKGGNRTIHQSKNVIDTDSSNNDNEDDDSEDDDDDEEEYNPAPKASIGMAGAMARILGGAAATVPKAGEKAKKQTTIKKAVVLSKTFTPLQKQQKKEKELFDAMKQKRRQRREVNLTAMHIPLSAAALSRPLLGKNKSNKKKQMGGGAKEVYDEADLVAKAMAKEIETERMHRRVATRGVVALFNTISKHQQQRTQTVSSSLTKSEQNEEVKKLSKHGFLDMLKKTGTANTKNDKEKTISSSSNSTERSKNENNNSGGRKWNALKDDFMMNSKLKDWDKALSSDEDDESDDEEDDAIARGKKRAANDDGWSDDDGEQVQVKTKRKK